MTKIYKYELKLGDNIVTAPDGDILCAQIQDDKIVVWIHFDEECETKLIKMHFSVVGTGHPIVKLRSSRIKYISTVQQGEFVWHVFYSYGNSC